MKVVYNWLKEFVDVTASPADLRARLSLAGVAVDSIEESAAGPVLDAEVTANRPDCLGHLGIAREVAAIYRLPLKPLHPKLKESAEKVADATRVEIAAPDLCGRFTARVLRGVRVQPSPDWLRQGLEAIGEKSINNVVDVTNYVMFELGHPLHAFDFDKLQEHRIIVRRAKPGEKIRTLDGAERTLTKDMCVVADAGARRGHRRRDGRRRNRNQFQHAQRPDRVRLVRSHFHSPHLQSSGLAQRSFLSFRARCRSRNGGAGFAPRCRTYSKVAGGELLAGVVDVYPHPAPEKKIELSRKELLRVMGADVPDRDIEAILSALGFHPVRVDVNRGSDGSIAAVWECRQVSWRQDVTRGIDLIEEVARHYGYDKFPPRLPAAKLPAHRLPHAEAQDRLRERIVALGYQEIVEIPIVDTQRNELFRPENLAPAVIGNPLAEDASVMRSTGTVSMLRAIEWNLNHGQRDLRLFEIGKSYELRDGEPVETQVLTLGATGMAQEKTIYEAAREFSFADLKGDLDRIGELVGGLAWQSGGPQWLTGSRAAQISLANKSAASADIGVAGQLAKRIADLYKFRQDVFVAELKLEPLVTGVEAANAARRFKPLPRFPAVERDFSLVLADGVAFAQVVETIRSLQIAEVESIEAADLFRGGQVPAGKFSLMIRVKFQSGEATFTDAQLNDFSARIVAALQQKLGATLRAI